MKGRMLVVLLVAFLAIGAFALGKTSIRVQLWGGEVFQRVDKEIYAIFEERNPDIKLELEAILGGVEKQLAMHATRTLPDLFIVDGYYSAQFIDKGAYLELSSLMKRDKWEANDILPTAYAEGVRGDKVYGFPYGMGTVVNFYNKTMFDKAGVGYPSEDWTFSSYLEASKKLTKDIDGDGKLDQWGHSFLTWQWWSWVYSNGGELIDLNTMTSKLDSPETIEAIQFLQDMRWKYKVAATPEQMEGLGDMFMVGKEGMRQRWDCAIQWFRVDIKDFGWSVGPLPKGKAGAITVLKGNTQGIYRYSKHPEEAWRLLQFLWSDEAQWIYIKHGMCMTLRAKHLNDPRYLKQDKPPYDFKAIVDSRRNGKTLPLIKEYLEINSTIWNPELDLVWLGKKSAEDALKTMAQKTNELLKKAYKM